MSVATWSTGGAEAPVCAEQVWGRLGEMFTFQSFSLFCVMEIMMAPGSQDWLEDFILFFIFLTWEFFKKEVDIKLWLQ